ncbi:MAG TPA: SGNH/GDSL hydrolase family protein [Verrucomicrobiae bacterium]|nr:SGNH/GDSL hydrolase family protein [Verrucomicrobiae bacterium]
MTPRARGTLLAALAVSTLAVAADAPPLDYMVWQPFMKQKNVPAPGVMAGIDGESHFETNSIGIRGPEFGDSRKKEYRILVGGGSATECFYLDQDEAWPALVGKGLGATADGRRTWLGSIGRSGHNSRDHVLEIRDLVPKLPVDALVVMMGVNDLGLRLAQDDAYNPDFLATEENVRYQARHAFLVHPDDPNLAFYQKGALGRLLGLDPDAQRRKPWMVVDSAGKIFLKWREYRRTGSVIDKLPDLSVGLAEYARNATEIARAAKTLGVRLVFVTQPVLWRAGLTDAESSTLWMGGIGDFQEKEGGRYYAPAALAEGMAAYNRALMEACAKAGAECLDIAATTPKDLTVFYDDCHFNTSGARIVAAKIREYLAGRPPYAQSKG